MRELNQICRAVITALQEKGLCAMAPYPAREAGRYDRPTASVAVETAESRTMGFCNYLGQESDPETGAVHELYGKQLEAVIAVEVRGERAALCEKGCESAAEALLEDLPSGIRPVELSWESLAWERETGCFLRRGHLRCQALFLARAQGEEAMFLDFRLKGAVTT